MRPMRFRTDDGLELVGELRPAEGTPRGSAVLAHPHPKHGGSKDHPLLWATRNELAGKRGLTVLSFNFRGIMGSEGTFGGGIDEELDLAAAITTVREEAEEPTLVVGWSFGAIVALRRAIEDDRIAALALIGLPLDEPRMRIPDLPDRDALRALEIPVLLIAGAADQFCPAPEVRSMARKLGNAEAVIVPDAGHFFDRREGEIAEMIGEFAERALPTQ